jgi:uncharacterized membrane protein
MMNRKKMFALCWGLIMVTLFAGAAQAQNQIGTNAVTGNTYVCFIVTPLAVLNTQIDFAAGASFSIESFPGYGFYAAGGELFTGAYWALNAKVGDATGDIIILLVGSSFAQIPVIAGTGTIIVQYSQVVPLVFFGWQGSVPEPA